MRAWILFSLWVTAVSAQNVRFPAIPAAVSGFNQSQSKWQIISRHKVNTLDGTVYSFKFLPNGTQAIVATADFRMHLVDLASNRVVWSVANKMNLEREFDGNTIYDVAPDGSEFLCNGQIDPQSPSGERTLVIRSVQDGSVIKTDTPGRSAPGTVRKSS